MKKFEDYTCIECKKEWISDEGVKDKCPICNGEMDIYYQPIK